MELLSKNNSDCLKGIFAIAILLSHLCGRTGIGSLIGLGPIYTALGYWAVSVFLFISGYGLAYSFDKKPNYSRNFISTKLLHLYILQLIFILLYYLLRTIFMIQPTNMSLLNSLFFGETIISNGWYLQVIILFYLIFYIISHFKRYYTRICILFIVTLLYIVICNYVGLSSTWYETAICFPLGVLIYNNRIPISQTYKSHTRWFVFSILVILFSISFLLSLLLSDYHVFFKITTSIFFAFLVVYSSNLLYIQNKITNWLKKYYLGIYLFQGCAFILLRNNLWYIHNHYLYFLMSIFITLISAYFIQPTIEKLVVTINKFIKLKGSEI